MSRTRPPAASTSSSGRSARSEGAAGRLILIPWHIGNREDVTVRALREVRRLRVLLVEEPDVMRRRLTGDYQIDCAEKLLLEIPFDRDAGVLKTCREALATEDVGLLSSSGVPCFIDPGAWLVRELRGLGTKVIALAGASALSTVMALSGEDWSLEDATFTFRFVPHGEISVVETLVRERPKEPIVLFLSPSDGPALVALMASLDPERIVSCFFDVTKQGEHAPLADRIETATARRWATKVGEIPWTKASDLAAVLHRPRR